MLVRSMAAARTFKRRVEAQVGPGFCVIHVRMGTCGGLVLLSAHGNAGERERTERGVLIGLPYVYTHTINTPKTADYRAGGGGGRLQLQHRQEGRCCVVYVHVYDRGSLGIIDHTQGTLRHAPKPQIVRAHTHTHTYIY